MPVVTTPAMISHPKHIAYEATEAGSGQTPMSKKIGVLPENIKGELHMRKFFKYYWSSKDLRIIYSSGK